MRKMLYGIGLEFQAHLICYIQFEINFLSNFTNNADNLKKPTFFKINFKIHIN